MTERSIRSICVSVRLGDEGDLLVDLVAKEPCNLQIEAKPGDDNKSILHFTVVSAGGVVGHELEVRKASDDRGDADAVDEHGGNEVGVAGVLGGNQAHFISPVLGDGFAACGTWSDCTCFLPHSNLEPPVASFAVEGAR